MSLAVANPWAVSCWFRQKLPKPYDFSSNSFPVIFLSGTLLFLIQTTRHHPIQFGRCTAMSYEENCSWTAEKIASNSWATNKLRGKHGKTLSMNQLLTNLQPQKKKQFQPLHFGSLTVRPWKCTFWPQKEAGSFSSHPFSVASCLLDDSGVLLTTSTTSEGALKVGAVCLDFFFPTSESWPIAR